MADAITHKRILTIAAPLVLSNISVPLVGLVDTGVVGQLPDSASMIGAVGLGGVIISLLYWTFGFLRMGTVGLTSQAVGALDWDEVNALFFRAVGLGFALGTLFILLQTPIFWAAFQLSPASDAVENLTRTYLQIRIFSAPAAVALMGVLGWLVAQERSTSVLILFTWINGLNILLDVVFVLGFDMGVAGVAWATFLAEWTGLIFGTWMCRSAFRGMPGWHRVLDVGGLWQMAIVNRDILIRTLLLLVAFTSFSFLGANLGDVTLAANTVLQQFVMITAFGMDGFALAAETLVGSAYGAKTVPRVRRAAIMTSYWGAGIAVAMSVVFLFFGPVIIDILTKDEAVRDMARLYMWWMVLTPILGWPSWMLDGIFIGATRSKDMRNMMVISFALYVLFLLVFLPLWGNDGLWLSITLFYVVRGITLGIRYPALERSAAL